MSPQTAIDTRARFIERELLVQTKQAASWGLRGWKDALDVLVAGWTATLALGSHSVDSAPPKPPRPPSRTR